MDYGNQDRLRPFHPIPYLLLILAASTARVSRNR
jgi:hypothetical protein